MQTLLMELRYSSEPDHREFLSGMVDGINDVVLEIANRFKLDILSVSHVIEDDKSRGYRSITCTAVCLLNGETLEHIGAVLEAENHKKGATMYCFAEAFKLSIRVSEIRYN